MKEYFSINLEGIYYVYTIDVLVTEDERIINSWTSLKHPAGKGVDTKFCASGRVSRNSQAFISLKCKDYERKSQFVILRSLDNNSLKLCKVEVLGIFKSKSGFSQFFKFLFVVNVLFFTFFILFHQTFRMSQSSNQLGRHHCIKDYCSI